MKTKWQTKKLGELCKLQGGFAFKSGDYKDAGIPLIRIQNLQDNIIDLQKVVFISESRKNELNNFLLKEKDILIAMSGATTGKMALVKKSDLPLFLNQRVGRFKVDINLINNEYLWYFLNLIKDSFLGQAYGGAQPNISPSKIENLEIPLPPLEAQKEIVAKLDEKFAKLREAKKLREEALADTEKILSQTLCEIFEEGKQKGWEEKSFEDVLNFKTGKLDSNAMVPGGEYPFFTCAQKTYEIDSYSFDQKAVLLAGNNAAGKYSVKFYDGKFDAYQRTYIISVKDEKQLDYKYLTNYISFILNDLRDLSVGANTKFLTMKVLNKIKIPVPELSEQQKIVTKLDKLSEKIKNLHELQKSQLEDLKLLEKAYLREAFAGELI